MKRKTQSIVVISLVIAICVGIIVIVWNRKQTNTTTKPIQLTNLPAETQSPAPTIAPSSKPKLTKNPDYKEPDNTMEFSEIAGVGLIKSISENENTFAFMTFEKDRDDYNVSYFPIHRKDETDVFDVTIGDKTTKYITVKIEANEEDKSLITILNKYCLDRLDDNPVAFVALTDGNVYKISYKEVYVTDKTTQEEVIKTYKDNIKEEYKNPTFMILTSKTDPTRQAIVVGDVLEVNYFGMF